MRGEISAAVPQSKKVASLIQTAQRMGFPPGGLSKSERDAALGLQRALNDSIEGFKLFLDEVADKASKIFTNSENAADGPGEGSDAKVDGLISSSPKQKESKRAGKSDVKERETGIVDIDDARNAANSDFDDLGLTGTSEFDTDQGKGRVGTLQKTGQESRCDR